MRWRFWRKPAPVVAGPGPVRLVLLAPNGMVATFDAEGRQIPELQGPYSVELRRRLYAAGYSGPITTVGGGVDGGQIPVSEWKAGE